MVAFSDSVSRVGADRDVSGSSATADSERNLVNSAVKEDPLSSLDIWEADRGENRWRVVVGDDGWLADLVRPKPSAA